MRPLKFALAVLLLALAVVGGLFTVALVGLTTLAVFLMDRFAHRTALSRPATDGGRHDSDQPGDIIDVVTTEVDDKR